MNDKRLHMHSLPLILFAVAVTAVVMVSVNAWRLEPITQALVRPGLRLESTDRGYVKVAANKRLPDEKAGAYIEMPSRDDASVMHASQAFDSIGLKITLDRAVQ